MRKKHGDEKCARAYEALWDNADYGMLWVSAEGYITDANTAAQQMLEYTEAELQGMHFRDITAFGDREKDEEMARRAASGEISKYPMFKTYNPKFSKSLKAKLQVIVVKNSEGDFSFFHSSITPVEIELCNPEKVNKANRVDNSKFLKVIKDYWLQILFIIAGIGAIIDQLRDK